MAGRNPVSVTEALNRLLAKGLVERSGKTQSRNGRPSAIYRLGEKVGHTIGISVDATGFRLVALDARRQFLRELERTLSLSADPSSHFDYIFAQISSELRGFLASTELRDRRMLAIGIAPPGMVDTEKGIWLHGLQVSGITHVALGDMLEKMFGVTVVVEDVARCLAYVEASRRPPEKARDLVYLYLGPGIGAGIMMGQEPYHGSHGMAGEVGHLVVEEDGARCPCGNIGCLETVVSSSSILQRFQKRLSEGVISCLQKYRDENQLTLEVIRDAATAGDRLAQSTLFELGTLLGDAVSKIIKLYNPRTLVIGGPVCVLGEHLREPMWIKVRQKVIPEMLVDLAVEIVPAKPREEAVGAAYLAERRFWREANEESIREE
ncbi:MAG: ROK family protein [Spirochaetia bacterium]